MKHPDHPWVLHHAAPVYILAFPETFDDDEIAQMYDALAHWWPQVRQPVITVVDYSVCRRADAWARRSDAYGTYAQRVAPYADKYLVASAVVVRDLLMQSAVRALFAASDRVRNADTLRFFQCREEAIAWASFELQGHRYKQRAS